MSSSRRRPMPLASCERVFNGRFFQNTTSPPQQFANGGPSLVAQRRRIDVPALFDPHGRYRYLNGINVAAILAIAGGVGVYYAVPQSWVKVVWGVGVSAALYLVIQALAAAVAPRIAAQTATASSQRSSSPS